MKNLFIVLKYTVIEVYHSKLMVGIAMLAFGLVVISYVASEFAYGAPAKVALDVGLGVMSLSNLAISIFIGATLLSKEIEQRTLYMIISRPISRATFIIGKILGLSSVLFLNTFLLGLFSMGLFIYYGGKWEYLFVWTLLFSFLEAFIVLLFSVVFSLVTNTTLSVVGTVGVFVVGHALNDTAKSIFVKISGTFSTIISASYFLVPNFYRLNLKDFLLYEQNIKLNYLLGTSVYAILYLLALFFLVTLLFRNKNLD